MTKTRKPKPKGRRRKVALPTDRNGAPIHVDDVLWWDDGTMLVVAMMTWYGDDLTGVGCWTVKDEDGGYADNLARALDLTALAGGAR